MKLLTSAAALINLSEDYYFQTDLFHTGVIEGTTLYGDIYVVGGFDPDFTDTRFRFTRSVLLNLSE